MARNITVPVDISPGISGSFQDADVTGVTGWSSSRTAILCIARNTDTSSRRFGARKKGSTDDALIREDIQIGVHAGMVVPLDVNGIGQIYVEVTTSEVRTVAWLDSEASFFTNALDNTPGVDDMWEDQDISADTGGDTAIGIFAVLNAEVSGGTDRLGIRKKGSTDDGIMIGRQQRWAHGACGVDGSEVFQSNAGQLANSPLVGAIGYVTTDATYNTNATDRSLGSTGSYANISTGAGATITLICYDNDSGHGCALREDGAGYDYYDATATVGSGMHEFIPAISDLIEGIIENTAANFFEMGFITAVDGVVVQRCIRAGH